MNEGLAVLRARLAATMPVLLTLLLILVGVLPFGIGGLGSVVPLLPVIAVFYWSVYRPDLLPFIATFMLGVVQDALAGTPIGLSSLLLMLVQAVVISQRWFFLGKPFIILWWGFLLVASGAAAVMWLLTALLFGVFPPLDPPIVQLALTAVSFPALVWLLGRAAQNLPRRV